MLKANPLLQLQQALHHLTPFCVNPRKLRLRLEVFAASHGLRNFDSSVVNPSPKPRQFRWLSLQLSGLSGVTLPSSLERARGAMREYLP